MAMSELKEAFLKVLAEWAHRRGIPDQIATMNEAGEVSIIVGDVVASIAYRDATDTVLLWFESGYVECAHPFRRMLASNYRFALTHGFTLAYAPRTNRIVVQDRRPAERLDSEAALDAWLMAGSACASVLYRAAEIGAAALPKEV